MVKRRFTNSSRLSWQQPLPVGLQIVPVQQQVEQATEEVQVHGSGKRARKKIERSVRHQASKRDRHDFLRPLFLIHNPILWSQEWNFIWSSSDFELWSLFNMTLQVLINIVTLWEVPCDAESRGHTGPYYAVKMWHTERMSNRHIHKLRSSILTLYSKRDVLGELEQAAFQKKKWLRITRKLHYLMSRHMCKKWCG